MTTAPRKKTARVRGEKSSSAPRPSSARSPARRPHTPSVGSLFERIVSILDAARARVVRAVNNEMVLADWQVGRELVEHVQEGDMRAAYGGRIIYELAQRLVEHLGRGFSTTNLRYFRTFYLAYADRDLEIRHMAGGESAARSRTAQPRPGRRIRHMAGGELPGREGSGQELVLIDAPVIDAPVIDALEIAAVEAPTMLSAGRAASCSSCRCERRRRQTSAVASNSCAVTHS